MQLTQIITILAVAVAGVAAAPGGYQQISRSCNTAANSNSFCCNPGTGGYMCIGSHHTSGCNGITLTCNSNDGSQNCGGLTDGTVIWA
ncbi:hypothetical protein V8E54_012802 [Elaphomyces granulatus]